MSLPDKLIDWRSKLNARIDELRKVPHEYGLNDCILMTASCIEATRGIDFAAKYRGKYKTERGALGVLKKEGVETPEKLVKKYLGNSMPIAFAKAGDVVCIDLNRLDLTGGVKQIGLTIGICNGSVSYFVGETGLISLPTLAAEYAFNG